MSSRSLSHMVAALAILGAACSVNPTETNGSGGATSTGGVSPSGGSGSGGVVNSGGQAGSGGSSVGAGGTTVTSSGGTTVKPSGTGGQGSGGVGPGTGGKVTGSGGDTGNGGASTGNGGRSSGTGGTSSGTGGRGTGTGGTVASNGGRVGGAPGTGGTVTSAGGSTVPPGDLPCDIYAAASTPCVAAYSMARVIASAYTGPLYQVRKGGSWNKTSGMSGGTFQDISAKDGYVDSTTQDTFCGTETCTVSKLYDQSGKKNDLTVAPKGCYSGTASEPDSEGSATKKSFTINGHKAYAIYMNPHDGMRNNACTGIPTKNTDQSQYVIADGNHAGAACCWDFGNTWPDNCNSHTMNPIFFGTGYWGKGSGSGPWFMGDFEGGVWAGGNGASTATNSNNPSMKVEFAFGMLKTSSGKYAIKAGDAKSGTLTTAYDGASPKQWDNGGAVLLGIGGDNSNSSNGTFYEGVMTTGLPSNATDDAIFKNVQNAGFGK
jgi:non-reducing end alpha-L-arabinofuranosidase